MTVLFWVSAATLLYVYIGYPALLLLLPKKPTSWEQDTRNLPRVTLLIPAFNEADVIESTVRNKLDQEYPHDRLEIIVISDGSDDGTDQIVKALAEEDPRVHLLRQTLRQGKTAGLNKAIAQATGEIVVFSDANSLFGEGAIQHLVSCFSDPEVGYVTGKMVYVSRDGTLIGDGCSAYMRYENALRAMESKVSSVVGVDGGIDAIRKSLYQPMSADQLPDFVLPLKVVEQRYRVIYQSEAILKEDTLSDSGSEYRMRVRVSLRAMWALWDMRFLLNPFAYGIFSFQLLSHKVLRYLAFIPLLSIAIANIYIVSHHSFYSIALAGQVAFYLAAAGGAIQGERANSAFRLAFYFSLINYAAMVAFFRFLRRNKIVIWQPRGGE